jgi:hypothetical protein
MQRAPSWDGATLAKAIAETRDFAGVTGRITIDPERNAKKSAVVVQMRSGIPVAVSTIEPELLEHPSLLAHDLGALKRDTGCVLSVECR